MSQLRTRLRKYPLPTMLLRELTSFFGTDCSDIHIHYYEPPDRSFLRAFACGNDLFFSTEMEDLGSTPGRFLLGHEVTHVLQQRAGRVCSAPGQTAPWVVDPALELEADLMGQLLVSGQANASKRARELLGLATPGRAPDYRPSRVCQPKIEVAGKLYPEDSPPDARLTGSVDNTKLYGFIRENKETFHFKNVEHLVKWVNRCAGLYSKYPTVFTESEKRPYFEKITGVVYTGITKRNADWSANLTVTTAKGTTIQIPVFTSVKRHLIHSYLSNQTRPREFKDKNSLVKDDMLFEQKLGEFARLHANAIKDNLMVFGYEPVLTIHSDSRIAFETDTTMLPNNSYAKYPNGIHSFPDSGTEVRSLTQQENAALSTFLLWFYRTEERLVEGQKFDKINLLSPGELERREHILKERNNKQKEIDKKLITSKQFKIPADLGGTSEGEVAKLIQEKWTADKKSFPYPPNHFADTATMIYELLLDEGKIPAIDKDLGPATKKVEGTKEDIKPFREGTPTIRFKTHKAEVKQHIKFLSPDLVAWAIGGEVSIEADAILVRIKEAKTASKATVKEQIQEEQKKLKPAWGKGKIEDILPPIIKDFYKFYQLGVTHDLFTTRL